MSAHNDAQALEQAQLTISYAARALEATAETLADPELTHVSIPADAARTLLRVAAEQGLIP